MSIYGPNNGTVPFTGFSPTLGIPDAVTPAVSGVVWNNGMMQQDNYISRPLRSGWNRSTRALMLALLGAATGGSAVANKTWVVGQQQAGGTTPQGGGMVQIATFALVNRVTTAADLTNMQSLINHGPVPASYPADLSTNGGGGKLGW